MDENEFWALIDRSREDLEAFDRIYREQLARAYRWDLWGAGHVINGGMSDDSFDYFRHDRRADPGPRW